MLHTKAVINWAKKNKKPIIVFDTETTGLKAETDVIIQISAQKLDPNTLEVKDTLDIYINPERSLPEFIVNLTGITDEKLKDCDTEDVAFVKIYNFFTDNACLMGHNVPFDIKFLSAMYNRQGKNLNLYEGELYLTIDTCQMARELLKKGYDVENHKLGTVASYYGADAGLSFHNSMDDVIACYRIFKAMYTDNGEKGEKKELLTINHVGFVFGFKGHNRVYVQTNKGAIYYDTLDGRWDSKEFDISKYDICKFANELYERYQVSSDKELVSMLYLEHCKQASDRVGRKRMVEDIEEAKIIAKKMNNKHFDVEIKSQGANFMIILSDFHKSALGKTVVKV